MTIFEQKNIASDGVLAQTNKQMSKNNIASDGVLAQTSKQKNICTVSSDGVLDPIDGVMMQEVAACARELSRERGAACARDWSAADGHVAGDGVPNSSTVVAVVVVVVQ